MDNINLNRENGQKLWAADWNKLVSTINLIIDAVNNQNNLPGITKLSQLINDSGFITQEDVKGKVNKGELAEVATSGSYNDLKDKPSQMTGPQGPEGKSAYQVAVQNGFIGTPQLWLNSLKGEPGQDGVIGLDGADGKSAYDLAVELGYEGTLELWLESLLGADGTDGTNGKSAYQSYLDTTSDNPPLTEEQWSVKASNKDYINLVDGDIEVEFNVNNNGHDYVDLDLPSGTLWSTMYLGAPSEEEEGLFYTWGGLQGYNRQEPIGNSPYSYYEGNTDTLPMELDSARQIWGGDWRMPTEELVEELILYTTQETINQTNDYILAKFKSKVDPQKYIYLYFSKFVFGFDDPENEKYYSTSWNVPILSIWLKDGGEREALPGSYYYDYGGMYDYNYTYSKRTPVHKEHRNLLLQIRPVINGVFNKLHQVCFTGSYNDLNGKPVNFFNLNTNGHEYLDFKLPSGTIWSAKFVPGVINWNTGEICINGETYDSSLPQENDVVNKYLGGDWTTPTYELYLELINYAGIQIETITDNEGNLTDTRRIRIGYKIDKDFFIFRPLYHQADISNNIYYLSSILSSSLYLGIQGGYCIIFEDHFSEEVFTNEKGVLFLGVINSKSSLSKAAFTGNYNDLSNKPTIPAAQIQADWDLSDNTALDYIKNKPTIPTVPGNELALSGGNTLSVVTTGDKYNWNNKANVWQGTQAQYDALSPNYDSNTIYIITAAS